MLEVRDFLIEIQIVLLSKLRLYMYVTVWLYVVCYPALIDHENYMFWDLYDL